MSEDFIVETFKASADLSERLNLTSQKFDITKSQIIRMALERFLADLDQIGEVVRQGVISDFVRQSTKVKR
jgi:hypothetical protein